MSTHLMLTQATRDSRYLPHPVTR